MGKKISLNGSYTAPSEGSSRLGATAPDKLLVIQIYLTITDVERQTYEDIVSNKSNHLKRSEFTRKRGTDREKWEKVVSFVKEHGMSVTHINKALRKVTVRASVKAISYAFGVTLDNYSHPDGDYINNDDHFKIPESLDGIVSSIIGCNTRKIATRSAHNISFIEPNATNSLPTHPGSFTAMQVAEAYNFPKNLDGSGETIGIIELSGGYRDSDLDAYFNAAGIAKPNIISVGPNNPGTIFKPAAADGEVALDIEVAGSICPGAKIVVYFSKDGATQQGFLDVLEMAIHDHVNNPSVISVSWGGAEVPGDESFVNQFKELCNDAVTLGITILMSSGDTGSPDGLKGGYLAPNFPASLPNVLACGGTLLKASGSTIESEVVWGELSSGQGASGGGISTFFPVPDYQSNSNVPVVPPSGIKPGFAGRGVPDIAGNAAPNSGYAVYVNSKFGVVGGTSAVAPLWAGLIILINQSLGKRVGFLNDKLYKMAGTSALRDITEGTNGIDGSDYTARTGWDPCTGLGTPDGTAILNALKDS